MEKENKALIISIVIFVIVAVIALCLVLNKGKVFGKSLVATTEEAKDVSYVVELSTDKEYLSAKDSETATLKVLVDGTETTEGVEYTSSDEEVLTVTDGVVTAVFSNGETRPIAIIPLALFVNPNGMEALNNNVWIATTESGNPLLTKATTGGAGEIVSSSLESSTVDLATEFSNMIIVQRAYSAAGKIMTTADEMLQELTNLV